MALIKTSQKNINFTPFHQVLTKTAEIGTLEANKKIPNENLYFFCFILTKTFSNVYSQISSDVNPEVW